MAKTSKIQPFAATGLSATGLVLLSHDSHG